MTKKHKKKNKEKKTKDTGIVLQTPPVSTTMSSSPTLAETLGDKLDSLRLSTPETTDFSVTAGMLQDYLCKKIDDIAFSGPGNSLNKDDYHAWCIDDQGLVCDYMDEQLMDDLEFGTCDIVRRPFTAHAIAKWLLTCDETYNAFLQGLCAEFGGDVGNAKVVLLSIINTPLFPPKNCYLRAKLLHESDPKKYSLVIGSLGFRQADGRIHWEYG
jgi:hypothetical protein